MSIFSEMNSNAICLVGPDHLLALMIYDETYQKFFKTLRDLAHLIRFQYFSFISLKGIETESR